jgi:hypothetical protein
MGARFNRCCQVLILKAGRGFARGLRRVHDLSGFLRRGCAGVETPIFHPTDVDLSMGTPAYRPARRSTIGGLIVRAERASGAEARS